MEKKPRIVVVGTGFAGLELSKWPLFTIDQAYINSNRFSEKFGENRFIRCDWLGST